MASLPGLTDRGGCQGLMRGAWRPVLLSFPFGNPFLLGQISPFSPVHVYVYVACLHVSLCIHTLGVHVDGVCMYVMCTYMEWVGVAVRGLP